MLIIYGAGKVGSYVLKKLNEVGHEVAFFCDSDCEKQGKFKDNLRVLGIDHVKFEKRDILLVAFLGAIYEADAFFAFADNVGIVRDSFFKQKKSFSRDLNNEKQIFWIKKEGVVRPVIDHLETNVSDICNLNCKGCSHFAQIFKDNNHISLENFRNDLYQISNNIEIEDFYLLGGEALLQPNIEGFMKSSREFLPKSNITIVSNGLLIPSMKESFFSSCVEYDIDISISGYPPTIKMKEKIINCLENNGVKYNFRVEVLDFGKNLQLNGSADVGNAFKKCRQATCHFLRDGRIYKCPFSALVPYLFKYYGLNYDITEGYDIYDKNLNWQYLAKLLMNNPIDACKYCGDEERFKWEIKQKSELSDWTI